MEQQDVFYNSSEYIETVRDCRNYNMCLFSRQVIRLVEHVCSVVVRILS